MNKTAAKIYFMNNLQIILFIIDELDLAIKKQNTIKYLVTRLPAVWS
jgi:hypothetical protein